MKKDKEIVDIISRLPDESALLISPDFRADVRLAHKLQPGDPKKRTQLRSVLLAAGACVVIGIASVPIALGLSNTAGFFGQTYTIEIAQGALIDAAREMELEIPVFEGFYLRDARLYRNSKDNRAVGLKMNFVKEKDTNFVINLTITPQAEYIKDIEKDFTRLNDKREVNGVEVSSKTVVSENKFYASFILEEAQKKCYLMTMNQPDEQIESLLKDIIDALA